MTLPEARPLSPGAHSRGSRVFPVAVGRRAPACRTLALSTDECQTEE
jgi:hypothetical protein